MSQRIAVAMVVAIGLCAQAPKEEPGSLRFEVASLKPSQPGGRGGGIRPAPGGQSYVANNIPLRLMIMVAYRVKSDQVIGGPGWVDTDRFDMNAKAERPSNVEELHTMLKNLLADRFKLQFRIENRELPVYTLTVDKSGPKLTPHEAQSAGDPWIDQSQEQFLHEKWKATSAPMDYFAWRLGMMLDRPVSDQTNLKGGYDFTFTFTREPPPGLPEGALLNGAPVDTTGPTIFEAVRQQLGLRLERGKGPVPVMAIEHVERPTEN